MRKIIRWKEQDALLELLRQARKDAELTQVEVAERLGKPQSFVTKYENGERRLDVLEFLAVAQALGVDPCDIVRKLQTSKR